MGNHGFSEEHVAKLESCQSIDELKEVARDLGMEISDEEIEGIASGGGLTCVRYQGMGGGATPPIVGGEQLPLNPFKPAGGWPRKNGGTA